MEWIRPEELYQPGTLRWACKELLLPWLSDWPIAVNPGDWAEVTGKMRYLLSEPDRRGRVDPMTWNTPVRWFWYVLGAEISIRAAILLR